MNRINDLILKFENNRKLQIILPTIFVIIFIVRNIDKFSEPEMFKDYFFNVLPILKNCNNVYSFNFISQLGVKFMILCQSNQLFYDYRVLAFFTQILIFPISYIIVKKVTNRNFIAVLSVLLLTTSPTINNFSVSATYPEFWVLFFILSVYFTIKNSFLSLPLFIISILCKPLSIVYCPILIYCILKDNNRDRKIINLLCYSVFLSGSMIFFIFYHPFGLVLMTDFTGFLEGLALILTATHSEFLILTPLPLVLNYLWNKPRHNDFLLVSIMTILLSMPLLQGLTNMTVQPYRFEPLFIFLSAGIGITLFGYIENPPKSFFFLYEYFNKRLNG